MVAIQKAALPFKEDRQTARCAAKINQDGVEILQEPQSLPPNKRSLHGLAAVR
jgi:hypothetical protein